MQAVVQPTPVQNAAQSHVAVTPTTPATQQAAEHLARQGTGASLDPAAAAELAATGYPGDEASREQLAAWMAAQARARGLPPELPVMASLVESELHNVDHGDADSLGYFQMRTSVWDQGEYAGFPQRPDLQVKWFLDHAETVKRDRLARGASAVGHGPRNGGGRTAPAPNTASHVTRR